MCHDAHDDGLRVAAAPPVKALLQHSIDSMLSPGLQSRRKSGGNFESSKDPVAPPFGFMRSDSTRTEDSSELAAQDYGWFEFDDGEQKGEAKAVNPHHVFRRRKKVDSIEALHEDTIMRLGLGNDISDGDDGQTTGDSGCCGEGGGTVLCLGKNEPNSLIVATRSYFNLQDGYGGTTRLSSCSSISDGGSTSSTNSGSVGLPAVQENSEKSSHLSAACAVMAFRRFGCAVHQHAEYQVVLTLNGTTLSAWKRYEDFVNLFQLQEVKDLPSARSAWQAIQRSRKTRHYGNDYVRAKSLGLSIFLGHLLFELDSPKILLDFVSTPDTHGARLE